MTDTVVIEGEVSLVNQVEGEVELINQVDGDPEVVIAEGGGIVYPHYQGDYTVTPSTTAQVLDTDGMVMDDDVTIQAVAQGSATTPATIITADPTISVSSGGLITATVSKTQQITPTVQEGYVSVGTPGNVGASGSATQQLSTQGAQTLYPATVDQTIPTHKYTTGVQTFKAVTVTGLTADKVLQGTTVEIGDSDDSDRIMKVVGTATGGITPTGTKTITAPGTYDVTYYANVEVEIDMWTEQTIATSGSVTQALDPFVMYHFTGALTALTITLATPSQGQIPHYHFDFDSGSTAPTLTLPNTVTMPDSFTVEASKRYEIDILNNFGTVAEWA